MYSFLKEWGTIYSILSGIADLGRLEHWPHCIPSYSSIVKTQVHNKSRKQAWKREEDSFWAHVQKHTSTICGLTRMFARPTGLIENAANRVYVASLFHDIYMKAKA